MKKFLLLFLFLFLSNNIFSQEWQRVDRAFAPSGVVVEDFSAPYFADFDGDGDFDLALGNINLRVTYFENTGTNQNPSFKQDTSMFSSIYANGYQFTNSDYPALADLDNDNDYDLVIGGYSGLIYYENKGDSSTAVWERTDSIYSSVNPQIGTDARPAFADLDGDGDIDMIVGIGESLFGGPTAGTSMGFRNIGTISAPVFERDDVLVTGIPDVGLNAYPALADLDGDGDYDMLMGRDGAAVYYYKNTGTKFIPAWTRENTVFSPVETGNYWKDPTFCDLDGDGDQDLIYGTDNGNLYFYENTGTPIAPQYVYNSNYFRLVKSDGWSTPSFADFDNDGDLDMLSGSTLGQFFYARNNGDSVYPGFAAVTSTFGNIAATFRSSPVFNDIDNDGDYDIVAGNTNGSLKLYINNNGTYTQNTTMFANIQVTYGSMPAFADIDGDGDEDLLVGSETSGGTKFFLRDTGDVFIQNTDLFSSVIFPGYSSPAFADIDNDGDYDLFIGRSNGSLYYYENTGTYQVPQWTQDNSFVSGIKAKQNAHPSFADLDSDGYMDMILGEYDGNFTWYRNPASEFLSTEELNQIPLVFNLMQNYPNPFNPSTTIRFVIREASHVSLKLYDLSGKEVAVLVDEYKNSGEYNVNFTAKGLSSGVYFYRLENGSNVITRKMLLLK